MMHASPQEIVTKTLSARLNYIKRLVCTGICFSLFSTFALLMGSLVLPFFFLLRLPSERRQRCFRLFVSRAFRLFVNVMQLFGLMQINVHDLDLLKSVKSSLFISNHPSLIDVVIIIAHLESIQCVVKSSLWSCFFIGFVVRGCGYIRNDTDPERLMNDISESLESGENILIFPEGTRSIPGEKLKFQRGTGHLALHLNADIQMITITCDPPMLLKGDKWYKIPDVAPIFQLGIGPSIETRTYHVDMPRPKRVRLLIRELENFYNGYLKL